GRLTSKATSRRRPVLSRPVGPPTGVPAMDPSPGIEPGQHLSASPVRLRPHGDNRPTSVRQRFRNRLIGGLIFALPIAITFSIVYWLLITLQRFVLDPLARLTTRLQAYIRHYPAL